MPDYANGKIYAIRAPGTDDVYIGSTTKTLSARMANHRAHCKRWQSGKGNMTTSFKILERGGAYIELIELYACTSKEELNRREGEVMRANTTAVNKQVAGRTRAETVAAYDASHKEQKAAYYTAHKEQKAAYDAANKERRRELQRIRYAARKAKSLTQTDDTGNSVPTDTGGAPEAPDTTQPLP